MQWQFKLIYSEGNHFCRGNGRTKKKAGGGLAAGGTGRKGAMGGAVTSLRLPSDFTNEMGKNCQTVRAGSNGHPVLRSLKPPSWRFRSGY